MGKDLLSKVFRSAFQTELSAGRPEGGVGRLVAPRRSADADGRLRFGLAERIGSTDGLKTRFFVFYRLLRNILLFLTQSYTFHLKGKTMIDDAVVLQYRARHRFRDSELRSLLDHPQAL